MCQLPNDARCNLITSVKWITWPTILTASTKISWLFHEFLVFFWLLISRLLQVSRSDKSHCLYWPQWVQSPPITVLTWSAIWLPTRLVSKSAFFSQRVIVPDGGGSGKTANEAIFQILRKTLLERCLKNTQQCTIHNILIPKQQYSKQHSQRFGRLHRLRSVDADAHFQDGVGVLRNAKADLQNPPDAHHGT